MRAALLPDRGVVRVVGDDARKFLNGLVTADIGKVEVGAARFAALLTPQGKIIADFIVAAAPAQEGGGLLLDCPRALASSLVQRLNFYKLRAKVIIEDLSETRGVLAAWDKPGCPAGGLCYPDPRLVELGLRVMLPPRLAAAVASEIGAELVDADAYQVHRIALGVPQGGVDFAYGDAFPHETDMDQLGGVDFDKGCYVGQEVVSRIEHRARARSRVMPVVYDGAAPRPGVAITADGRPVGTTGSAADGRGLALLRLDKVEEALEAGTTLEADGVAVRPLKPSWARFAFPAAAKAAE